LTETGLARLRIPLALIPLHISDRWWRWPPVTQSALRRSGSRTWWSSWDRRG